MTPTLLSFILFSILGNLCLAFVPSNVTPEKSSRLFGISQWRDQALADLSSSTLTRSSREWSRDRERNEAIRQLPIHLVNSNKVALQGETLYFQFTRDDEVRLFQQAIDCHQGVFGLGFHSMADGIFYDKISLVEIKDYNMMGDEFGIFLTVQVVGCAMILETQVHPGGSSSSKDNDSSKQPVMALCSEILNRQERVPLQEASEMGQALEKLIAEVCNAENESCIIFGEDEDRWARYRDAYHRALESDALGYTYSALDNDARGSSLVSDSSSSDGEKTPHYSWKELNAISWAAFSSSEFLQQEATYRLAALDNDCMTNRLLLATYWLSDVLQDVKQGAI
jgi:hypothetical protein